MEGPPLGPGGEDITWPDQVAPRGRKASSTRKIKPQTSNHFEAGERAPADPPFSGGRTRTCGSYILERANAHLRILHFWAGKRAPADPPFSDGRTGTRGSSIFRRANAHLRILHFQAGERALADP